MLLPQGLLNSQRNQRSKLWIFFNSQIEIWQSRTMAETRRQTVSVWGRSLRSQKVLTEPTLCEWRLPVGGVLSLCSCRVGQRPAEWRVTPDFWLRVAKPTCHNDRLMPPCLITICFLTGSTMTSIWPSCDLCPHGQGCWVVTSISSHHTSNTRGSNYQISKLETTSRKMHEIDKVKDKSISLVHDILYEKNLKKCKEIHEVCMHNGIWLMWDVNQ